MAKKLIYKALSWTIVILIFFFLARTLLENWQKVREYHFSFNHFYLILSFIFLGLSMLLWVFIWNKILRQLEPQNKISYFKALKIFIYSWFGRYVPGKVWMYSGRIYLGAKEGISKKTLAVSSLYEIVLFITSEFLFALILLSIAFGVKMSDFYLISLLIILGGLIFLHPKIFYLVFNFLLKKIRKVEISPDVFFSYRIIVKMILYYFIIFIVNGIAFFLLINSFTYLSFYDILGLIGMFHLSSALGVVALFAPSGLGVREGVLAFFLQTYFPAEVAILISLISRIWLTFSDVVILAFTYLYSKIKKDEVISHHPSL